MAKPSIVFVSGAWHSEFHIQPCVPYFERLDYRVIPCPMYSAGDRKPKATFADDVNCIRRAIEIEIDADRNVCVISHSASGVPATEAINQHIAQAATEAKGKLVHLILVAAFLHNEGRVRQEKLDEGWFHVDFETSMATVTDAHGHFLNDMTVTAAQPFVDALQPQTLTGGKPTSDSWKIVPGSYILCLQDHTLLPSEQRSEAEECGMDLVEMDTAHDPFVSQPEEFARVVDCILQL